MGVDGGASQRDHLATLGPDRHHRMARNPRRTDRFDANAADPGASTSYIRAVRASRLRHRREQPLGVRIAWFGEHPVGVALLDDLALEHHGHLVGEVLDHRQVVRDE